MAVLTVRNLDDDILAGLKSQARTHNRSLEAEVRTILAQAVRSAKCQPTVEELLLLVDKVAALTPPGPQTDSAQLLREARDDR